MRGSHALKGLLRNLLWDRRISEFLIRQCRKCISFLIAVALLPTASLAQGEGMVNGPFLQIHAEDGEEQATVFDDENEEEREAVKPESRRILPFLAGAARERGFSLPRTFGAGLVYVNNHSRTIGDHLAISAATGNDEPSEILTELPQVTGDNFDSRVESGQIKFDVFIFPFYNVFVSLGRVEGDVDIGLLVDLDELLPPIFCRFNECGVRPLNFTLPVENTTTTFGNTLAYGGTFSEDGHGWFVTATGTRTISVSSQERSDIKSTSASARAGLRFQLDHNTFVSPYLGYAYFDQKEEVTGIARLEGVLESGDLISVRYNFRVDNKHKSKAVLGINVEASRALFFQGELNTGRGGDSVILSSTARF